MTAPTDLEDLGYGRGFLRPAPAASVRRLDVVLGRPLDINSAYRDWNAQMRLYLAYQRDPRNNPLALHPDKSWHCKGLAIDTDDRLAVFREHGWLFEVRGEPWHGQYYPNLDLHRHEGTPASGGARPITPTTPTPESEDDNMGRFRMATSINDVPNGPFNRWSCDSTAGTMRNIDADEWDFQERLGIPEPEPGIQPSDRLTKRGYRQIG